MQKAILVSIALFVRNIDQLGFDLWMQPRLVEGPLYGKWEFPGGKIESGENPAEAAAREVLEEVEIQVDVNQFKFFKIQTYEFNQKYISLYVFFSKRVEMPSAMGKWFRIEYLSKSDFLKDQIPGINHLIIDELASYFQKQCSSDLMELVWKS